MALTILKIKDDKNPKFSIGVEETMLGSHIYELTMIICPSIEFALRSFVVCVCLLIGSWRNPNLVWATDTTKQRTSAM